MRRDLEFAYVGDPMCSWCWGFSPVMRQLTERYMIPVRVIVGGLRPGAGAQPLDERLRGFLLEHWSAVEAASGQPFTLAALERTGWVYDTEPSCRAVVAMRQLAPSRELDWFAYLQHAFYAEGADVADEPVLVSLAGGFDADQGRFADALRSQATRERTLADFAEAHALGATGFPTLLLREAQQWFVVTRGFVPWEQLEPGLSGWLRDRYGEVAAGPAGDVGQPS